MDEGKEAAIRERAFQIWQESGGAHGHDEEHWRQAERDYGGDAPRSPAPEGTEDGAASPSPARDKPSETPRT